MRPETRRGPRGHTRAPRTQAAEHAGWGAPRATGRFCACRCGTPSGRPDTCGAASWQAPFRGRSAASSPGPWRGGQRAEARMAARTRMVGHGARGLAQGRPPPRGGVEPQRGRPGGSAAPGGGHRPPRGRRRAPGLRLLPWASPASPRMSRVTAGKKLASLCHGASTGPPGLCEVRAELRVQHFGQSRAREAQFEGHGRGCPCCSATILAVSPALVTTTPAWDGGWTGSRKARERPASPAAGRSPRRKPPARRGWGDTRGPATREAPAGPPAPRTRPHLTGSFLPPTSRPPPPRPRARCCPRSGCRAASPAAPPRGPSVPGPGPTALSFL